MEERRDKTKKRGGLQNQLWCPQMKMANKSIRVGQVNHICSQCGSYVNRIAIDQF